jgi:lysophospholipase L1-like esterase
MARRKNPTDDLLLYAGVAVGALLVGKLLFGAKTASAGELQAEESGSSSEHPSLEVRDLSGLSGIDWPKERVLLIGDSLALPLGLGNILKRRLGDRQVGAFKNVAVGGTNIMQWSDNRREQGRTLESELASFQPTLVLISLGTNDEMTRGYKDWAGNAWKPGLLESNQVGPNFSVAKQRRSDILRLARKLAGVKSVWLGPPTSPSNKWPMERDFRDLIAATWHGRFVNTEAISPQKAPDGIHCNNAGYTEWGDSIVEKLDALTKRGS